MTMEERRRGPGGWAQGAAVAAPRRWLEEQRAAGRPAAAILLAFSRLDLLNAAHGRKVGDAVLRTARQRLEAVAGPAGGAVARLGGWRFVLTVVADEAAALALAHAAADALARPFEGGTVVGARAAVAVGTGDEDGAALLMRAGEGLGQAHAGEAGAPVLAQRGRAASLDALAVDLHHAIARGEIDILFQPQLRLSDDAITGAEALARWRHPRLGTLGAHELFAAAAWADLELPLSEHIQARALAEAAAWPPTLADLTVSINITAGDVVRAGFAEALLARAAASAVSPARLTLELTEVGPIADLPAAAAALARLRAAGCGVAIDDFGAGYSSLAYLKTLPVDTIKLDKSLVDDLHAGSREARLVEGAIAMAQALGLSVTAEGVETPEQRAVLAAAGCDRYQGYLCAPPLDSPGLARIVEERACAR